MAEIQKKNERLESYFGLTEVHKYYGWFLSIGIVMILLGMVAVGAATFTTLLSMTIFASLLIVAGIVQSINAFRMYRGQSFFANLLIALFYLVVGLLMLFHPAVAAITVTLMLGAFYIVSGLTKAIAAVMYRFANWGWMFLSGLVSFLLGFLILAQWPTSGLWVLGLFIGIDMIVVGWLWIMLAMSAKNSEIVP